LQPFHQTDVTGSLSVPPLFPVGFSPLGSPLVCIFGFVHPHALIKHHNGDRPLLFSWFFLMAALLSLISPSTLIDHLCFHWHFSGRAGAAALSECSSSFLVWFFLERLEFVCRGLLCSHGTLSRGADVSVPFLFPLILFGPQFSFFFEPVPSTRLFSFAP